MKPTRREGKGKGGEGKGLERGKVAEGRKRWERTEGGEKGMGIG